MTTNLLLLALTLHVTVETLLPENLGPAGAFPQVVRPGTMRVIAHAGGKMFRGVLSCAPVLGVAGGHADSSDLSGKPGTTCDLDSEFLAPFADGSGVTSQPDLFQRSLRAETSRPSACSTASLESPELLRFPCERAPSPYLTPRFQINRQLRTIAQAECVI